MSNHSSLEKDQKIKLVYLDKEELNFHFARSIADEIKENNEKNRMTKLILPVGPISQYPLLAEITNQERISWKNVYTFNMDEYLDWEGRPISKENPLSFLGFMESFFASIDKELRIPSDQMMFPDIYNIDLISEKIQRLGGIDTCYGGIGVHGHIAFNEPIISRFHQVSLDEFLNSKTRIVCLSPETIVMNSIRANGGHFAEFPPMAVTLGMKDIMGSKRIRLYCNGGEWQKTALREAVKGEKRLDYPISLLQGHTNVQIFSDQVKASDL
ncbi:hypothetical protein [Paenisporosarcina sp. TG-14]|uniref:hypothetical protein n=1 Tax=Paenisporosarcina sp. TG-14 TaxID=1231057 RepID=UPI0002F00438|nr:hypothetical protein [Paenisporosarcina sp. TG-14]